MSETVIYVLQRQDAGADTWHHSSDYPTLDEARNGLIQAVAWESAYSTHLSGASYFGRRWRVVERVTRETPTGLTMETRADYPDADPEFYRVLDEARAGCLEIAAEQAAWAA